MAEPGGLPSLGSHRVGHDWNNLAAAADTRGLWVCAWCFKTPRTKKIKFPEQAVSGTL